MKNLILLFLILTDPILLRISRKEMTKQFLHNYETIKNQQKNKMHRKMISPKMKVSQKKMKEQFYHNLKTIKNQKYTKIHRKLLIPSKIDIGEDVLGGNPIESLVLIVAGFFIANHLLSERRRERKLNKKIVLTERQAKILQECRKYSKGTSKFQGKIEAENKQFMNYVKRRGNWKNNLTPDKSLRMFKSYLNLYKEKNSKKLFKKVKSLMYNMIG